MAARRLILVAGLALALVAGLLATGCGGSPRDLGTVQPRMGDPIFSGPWTLVEVEGIAPSPADVEALIVEVARTGAR